LNFEGLQAHVTLESALKIQQENIRATKMNQRELTKILSKKINLPAKKTRKLIESFGDVISLAVSKGEKVTYSNFGTFYLVNYPSKVINHPIFGKKKRTVMLATNVVKWMPSDSIKDLVNHHLQTENVTTFGAAKTIREAKKKAGIAEYKALDISKAEHSALIEIQKKEKEPAPEEEITEIPIRVIKKDWTDLPITHLDTPVRRTTPFTRALSQVEYIDLSKIQIPSTILCLVPKEIAHRTKVVPIDLKDEILIIGMTDPTDHEALDTIKKLVRKQISPRLISEKDLTQILNRYDMLGIESAQATTKPAETRQIDWKKTTPVSRVINLILKRAVREQATMIHFDTEDDDIVVRFRIGDQLLDKASLSKSLHQKVLAHFKRLVDQSEEKNGVTRQLFSLNVAGVPEEFELIGITAVDGEKIVIKTKNRLKELKKLTEIGFRDRDYQAIIENAPRPGVNLITGQEDVGRAGMFYALADFYRDQNLHVVTLEKSPALAVSGVSQIDMNKIPGFDLNATISTLAAFDCDVLMLDSIPGAEIFNQILTLFAEKIIVISVEAYDSITAITTLLGTGINPAVFAKKLNLILASKEISRLCPHCRELVKIDSKTVRQIRDILADLPADERARLRRLGSHFYQGQGCKKCNGSGHIGNTMMLELLVANEKIRDLIADDFDAEKIRKEALKNHFTTYAQDGIIIALIGEVAISDVLPEIK